ncbi:hypothetical protein BDZ91DRAFT_736562, partial [Kalaharituber pfeilii]
MFLWRTSMGQVQDHDANDCAVAIPALCRNNAGQGFNGPAKPPPSDREPPADLFTVRSFSHHAWAIHCHSRHRIEGLSSAMIRGSKRHDV